MPKYNFNEIKIIFPSIFVNIFFKMAFPNFILIYDLQINNVIFVIKHKPKLVARIYIVKWTHKNE